MSSYCIILEENYNDKMIQSKNFCIFDEQPSNDIISDLFFICSVTVSRLFYFVISRRKYFWTFEYLNSNQQYFRGATPRWHNGRLIFHFYKFRGRIFYFFEEVIFKHKKLFNRKWVIDSVIFLHNSPQVI